MNLSPLGGGVAKPVAVRKLKKELKAAGFRHVRTNAHNQVWQGPGGRVVTLATNRKEADSSQVREIRYALCGGAHCDQRRRGVV
jgi:hypothetical protein